MQNLGKGIDEDGDVEAAGAEAKSVQTDAQESGNPCRTKSAFLGIHKSTTEPKSLLKEFGRLTVEGGRSRYVSNKFWVSLSEEVSFFVARDRLSLFLFYILNFGSAFCLAAAAVQGKRTKIATARRLPNSK